MTRHFVAQLVSIASTFWTHMQLRGIQRYLNLIQYLDNVEIFFVLKSLSLITDSARRWHDTTWSSNFVNQLVSIASSMNSHEEDWCDLVFLLHILTIWFFKYILLLLIDLSTMISVSVEGGKGDLALIWCTDVTRRNSHTSHTCILAQIWYSHTS